MNTLTLTQVGRIVERHLTKNKKAVIYNRKYLNSSPRARIGHNLRRSKGYYRKKLIDAKLMNETYKNMTPYINHCRSKIKELSKKLKSLGFRP